MGKYIKQRASIIATRKALGGARNSEFQYTQDVLGAIYGNAASTIGGGKAALTGEQARLMSSLKLLKQNQAQGSKRTTRRTENNISNLYGSSTLGAVAPYVDTVRTAGKAGTKAVNARAAAAGIVGRGNKAAMNTLAEGVKMAQAGAEGQLADALAYRAKNDASLVAQQELALQQHRYSMVQMREQNKLDLENYRKKAAMEDQAAGNGTASALTDFATGTVPDLQRISNELFEAGDYPEGKKPSASEIANAWAAESGYGVGTPQYDLALAAAGAVARTSNHNDPNPEAVAEAIGTVLSIQFPTLKPAQLTRLQAAALKATQNWSFDAALAQAEAPPNTSPGGSRTEISELWNWLKGRTEPVSDEEMEEFKARLGLTG